MNRYPGWEQRAVSARDVVSHLKSRQKIFVHGAAATPTTLLDAMVERTDLEGVELFHLHLSGPCRFSEERYRDAFIANPLFTDEGMRGAVDEGRAVFVPVFLSDIPGCSRRAAFRWTSRWSRCRRPTSTAVHAGHLDRRRQGSHRARDDHPGRDQRAAAAHLRRNGGAVRTGDRVRPYRPAAA